MRNLIWFVLISLILFSFSYRAIANDRKEPDYVYYEAILSQPQSVLQKGIFKMKIDIDHTFAILDLSGVQLPGTLVKVSMVGPNNDNIKLPSDHFSNYKISLTEDKIDDISQGLYSVEITTSKGHLHGQINPSKEFNPEPTIQFLDINADGKISGDDFKTFVHDISMTLNKKKSNHTMRTNDPAFHPLSAEITKELSKNKPTLLAKYFFYKHIPDYKTVSYYPRKVETGLQLASRNLTITEPHMYKGWDLLNTPNDTESQTLVTPLWLRLTLNRPATVGIVWFGSDPKPLWLQSWTLSKPIQISGHEYPVFIKKSISNRLDLGSILDQISSKKTGTYLVLISEENGLPSQDPVVPFSLEVPKANEPCPDWVHDQYLTTGPDGRLYTTWHPQIDPVFWCYFGHEHGADPSAFDSHFKLPFGYAGAAMGMHEKHQGFKVYIWDDKYGYRFMALQHQGTSSNQAVCGRYHELDFFIKKEGSDEILSKQYFVGDYGVSRSLVTGKPLTNSQCPNQESIVSGGARFLPIENERKSTESWVVGSKYIIGFRFSDFVVDTLDSVRLCNDYACDTIKITSNSGSLREISYVGGLGPVSGVGHRGTFYTDPTGTKLFSKSDPDAVEQYIKPGLAIASDLPQSIHLYNSTHCYDVEGFGSVFTCGIQVTAAPEMRENSLKVPN